MARFLREAGYHTELDLGHKAVGAYHWVLSLSREGSFQLTNMATGEKGEVASATEILGRIEGTQ